MGIPRAVDVVYKKNPRAVHDLRIGGVEYIDCVNPDNSEIVRGFVEFVKKAVLRRYRELFKAEVGDYHFFSSNSKRLY